MMESKFLYEDNSMIELYRNDGEFKASLILYHNETIDDSLSEDVKYNSKYIICILEEVVGNNTDYHGKPIFMVASEDRVTELIEQCDGKIVGSMLNINIGIRNVYKERRENKDRTKRQTTAEAS